MSADTFDYVQAQPFFLSGGGAVSGATSVVLKSMTGIDGALLTMANFGGVQGFGTIEPGSGTQEEQIVFTGITQNSNGTATLTGVKSVLFITPYTQTSGLAKTHAGSTSFVISNTSGFYDALSGKANDETITGVWTFPSADPSRAGIGSDTDTAVATAFVTLGQLSRQAISGASNAATTVKGIVQLSTQAQTDARTTTGSTGALLAITPDVVRSTLLSDYVADTGAADAYAIAPTPTITAYAVGQRFTFKVKTTNTTTSTLVVNALSATAIFKRDGTVPLVAGDLVAGQVVEVVKAPNGFQLIVPTASVDAFDYQSFTGSGTWTKPSNLPVNAQVFVQIWGGGGGGGSATSSGNGTASGGGGGGAYKEITLRASDCSATETVTIGAGGAADTVGGNTTFGTHATAYGGGGGTAATNAQVVGGAGGGGSKAVGSSPAASSVPGAGGGYLGGAVVSNAAGADGMGGGGGGSGTNGGSTGNGGGSVDGGGGGGSGNITTAAGTGGGSIRGGGGGGGGQNSSTSSGGASEIYGGVGGAGGGNAAGSVGTAPGGGGGGAGRATTSTSAGGAGARGECRVWTFL